MPRKNKQNNQQQKQVARLNEEEKKEPHAVAPQDQEQKIGPNSPP